MKKEDSRIQVELGDDAKYPVAGVGTIPFQLKSGNSLDFDIVLFVPVLSEPFGTSGIRESNRFWGQNRFESPSRTVFGWFSTY
jgi:hypothetical protein